MLVLYNIDGCILLKGLCSNSKDMYVRNKSRPEGFIARGFIVEECMIFCSRYLHDVDSSLTRPARNDDD